LKKENEPQIWNAIKFGTVMENVVVKNGTREPDFSDDTFTENTRAVYPLEFIPNSIIPSIAGHPKVIIFLTADAFGVMPPIAKLSKESAMYHFMSGYTSKLAGTERGITEPKETFHSVGLPLCLTLKCMQISWSNWATSYKIMLVNTGWSGSLWCR
jgi:phosphoenolpyruvate carboxykinase (ATP)